MSGMGGGCIMGSERGAGVISTIGSDCISMGISTGSSLGQTLIGSFLGHALIGSSLAHALIGSSLGQTSTEGGCME